MWSPAGCTKGCACARGQDLARPLSVCHQPHSEPPGESARSVPGRPPYPGAAGKLRGISGCEHGRDPCPPQLPGEASAPGGHGGLLWGLPSGPGFPSSCGHSFCEVHTSEWRWAQCCGSGLQPHGSNPAGSQALCPEKHMLGCSLRCFLRSIESSLYWSTCSLDLLGAPS